MVRFMIARFKCPKTGVYLSISTERDDGQNGIFLTGREKMLMRLKASTGKIVESGVRHIKPGHTAIFNNGQHSEVGDGVSFVREADLFVVTSGGEVMPPAENSIDLPKFRLHPFFELKDTTPEEASRMRPMHHYILDPEKLEEKTAGGIYIPAVAGRYDPMQNWDGDNRPKCATVLAKPLRPVNNDGTPFTGRLPEVGDKVWFLTLAWAGGTYTNDPFEDKRHGHLNRWPGMLGVEDMHMGMTPSGEVYAIGENGLAMQVEHPDGLMKGHTLIGAGKFICGGTRWESVHGRIKPGAWVSFRVVSKHSNTIAPSPWGWVVIISPQMLTGISDDVCDWPEASPSGFSATSEDCKKARTFIGF